MTEIKDILALVKPQFRLDIHHGWHGVAHWSRVYVHGMNLLEQNWDGKQNTPTNQEVIRLFAFMHDSQRFDEGSDMDHGPRAVEWINQLMSNRQLRISDDVHYYLSIAINGHSDGLTSAPPVVQCCWDADRLDLGRVGIMPDPRYLCTPHAKKPEVIARAWEQATFTAMNS